MKSFPVIVGFCLTYNHEDSIVESLNSFQKQSEIGWQIHIFDDASTDQTKTRIRDLIQFDKRFELSVNEYNLGFPENLNKVLKLMSTTKLDFLAWLSPDDLWAMDWLACCVNTLEQNTNCGVSQSFVLYDYGGDLEIRKYKPVPAGSGMKIREIKKGYGQILHGLWNRTTLQFIINLSNAIPIQYLLRIETFFTTIIIQEMGLTVVTKNLHTKNKISHSKNRYQEIAFFQSPVLSLRDFFRVIPAISKVIMFAKSPKLPLLFAFMLDCKIAFDTFMKKKKK